MYLDERSLYGSLPSIIRGITANIIWFGAYPNSQLSFCNASYLNSDKVESQKLQLYSPVWHKKDKRWYPGQIKSISGFRHEELKTYLPKLNITFTNIGIYAKLVNFPAKKRYTVKIKFADLRKMGYEVNKTAKVFQEFTNLSIMMAAIINFDYLEFFNLEINNSELGKVLPIWEYQIYSADKAREIAMKIHRIIKIFCIEHRTIFPLQLKSEFQEIVCK